MNAVGGEETVAQKRIGLFKQLVPSLTRLGMIAPTAGVLAMKEKEALQKVAAQEGFEFAFYGLNTIDDLESVFAEGLRDDMSAFYISGEPLLASNLSRVMTFVTASRNLSSALPRLGARRASDVLCNRPDRRCASRWHLCWENIEWCQPRRSSNRAGEQIHSRDQSENRTGAWHRRASDLAGHRR